MPLDSTGKNDFDSIYTAADPRAYFATLRELDYDIPQLAKPYIAKLIEEYRTETGITTPTVLDLGCSYGVNSALLRCDATMDELYDHYASCASLSRDELIERDQRLIERFAVDNSVHIIGLDASGPALEYALDAGIIDSAIHADFEENEPTPEQADLLATVDIVISTGCVGYVTDTTLVRIAAPSQPWMTHFVLRMFSYPEMAQSLEELGYDTVAIGEPFRQRRFASDEEKAQILANLADAGVDSRELEDDGWLYANQYISRPREPAGRPAPVLTAVPS